MTLRSNLGGKAGGLVKEANALHEPALADVEERLSFEFSSETAKKAFSYIISAFIEDYMRQKLSLEKSGWRTLVDIIKHGGVPKSSVYSTHWGMGSAISELEKRGLVEIRFFPGERGAVAGSLK
jgi:hypothetical protein